MIDLRRVALSFWLGCFLLLTGAGMATSQTVQGWVTDAETGEFLSGVTVVLRNDRNVVVASVTTGEAGAFVLGARSGGMHAIEATRVGYAPVPPRQLTFERDLVDLEIQLSRTPIALEAITVTGVRRDPRREATFEGMLVRRAIYPSVGSRRVMLRTDPQFVAAGQVEDVLRWVLPARGCTIVYWNGQLVHNEFFAGTWITDYPVASLEAVEHYRTLLDAPFGFMEAPSYAYRGGGSPNRCRVVALWARRSADP